VDDLVQWLRAQLDEDERIAREAGGAAWEELPVSGWVHTSPLPDTEWQPPGYDHHVASAPLPADRVHIVRHDPARVLREVDAKRRLLELHAARERGDGCVVCDDGNDSCGCLSGPSWGFPCDTVKILAVPYAGRPGYREEWRP
jgi:hypothetical protein